MTNVCDAAAMEGGLCRCLSLPYAPSVYQILKSLCYQQRYNGSKMPRKNEMLQPWREREIMGLHPNRDCYLEAENAHLNWPLSSPNQTPPEVVVVKENTQVENDHLNRPPSSPNQTQIENAHLDLLQCRK
uniref:Uncharacterized protein n=1 Tax=Nelumbo nucifera TaxID=4432 RepID=A0A822YU72_NELNU|nr:TPA_asm: hypothetical protein HUJ06_011639 [Nelumbo nucifera]